MTRPGPTSTFADGRNMIPLANSKSKCLLENWVEERATSELDKSRQPVDPLSINLIRLKESHRGILTTNYTAATRDLTCHLDSFRPQPSTGYRDRGARAEITERMLYERVLKEMEDEKNQPDVEYEQDDLKSTFQKDFNIDEFSARESAPTNGHDYKTEAPVTFWTEHVDKLHGVSQIKKTFDTPFRKNAAFTTPIANAWDPDKSKPYEHDHVPNM